MASDATNGSISSPAPRWSTPAITSPSSPVIFYASGGFPASRPPERLMRPQINSAAEPRREATLFSLLGFTFVATCPSPFAKILFPTSGKASTLEPRPPTQRPHRYIVSPVETSDLRNWNTLASRWISVIHRPPPTSPSFVTGKIKPRAATRKESLHHVIRFKSYAEFVQGRRGCVTTTSAEPTNTDRPDE